MSYLNISYKGSETYKQEGTYKSDRIITHWFQIPMLDKLILAEAKKSSSVSHLNI